MADRLSASLRQAAVPGRLHAGTVQHLSLDGRGVDYFLGNPFDDKPLPSSVLPMFHASDNDTSALKELLLRMAELCEIICEMGPVRELPVPEHDRSETFY